MKGDRVRLTRIGLGLSQQQLASMVGVSRQAIAAIEAGSSDPSLKLAFALGGALQVGVDELFAPAIEHPSIPATSLQPDLRPSRADLSWVGARAVALPRVGDHSLDVGFRAAGSVVDRCDGSTIEITPSRTPTPALVVAGCDPALALLPSVLSHLEPAEACLWWPASNAESLELLRRGLVHVAGFHVAHGSALPKADAEFFLFAQWREGVAFSADRPDARSIRKGLRLANRQAGSEARVMVDEWLDELGVDVSDVASYHSSITAHTLVGSAVAAGIADFGVTIEPVAIEFGLNFLPRATEDFLLAIPEAYVHSPQVRSLFRALTGQEFRAQLGAIRGYLNVERSGEPISSCG